MTSEQFEIAMLGIAVGLPMLILGPSAIVLWWPTRDTTPAFKPSAGCETVRIRMAGGGGGQSSANMTGGSGGPGIAMIVEEYYEMDVPEKSIIDASHEIAALAVSQRDSVNMYSAVREKAVEVLTRLTGLADSKPQS